MGTYDTLDGSWQTRDFAITYVSSGVMMRSVRQRELVLPQLGESPALAASSFCLTPSGRERDPYIDVIADSIPC